MPRFERGSSSKSGYSTDRTALVERVQGLLQEVRPSEKRPAIEIVRTVTAKQILEREVTVEPDHSEPELDYAEGFRTMTLEASAHTTGAIDEMIAAAQGKDKPPVSVEEQLRSLGRTAAERTSPAPPFNLG
jgi:hypothetical protein